MIHKTAVVESGAELAADVEVGPFAYVAAGARIGAGCAIGPHATVYGSVELGPGTRVYAGAVLGDLPQDLGFDGGRSGVRIGARCTIREGVTIHRGSKAGTVTEVGDDCFLMANSHAAHNVRLGAGVILANGALLGGYVEVGDRAFISGSCMAHQFVRIGRLVMMGSGCLATKDVPPFCLMGGLCRNVVSGLNIVGMRRAGLGPDDRRAVRRAFDRLYRSGLNVSEAVAALRAESDSGPAREFREFIAQSRRGICRYGSARAGAGEGADA